MTSDAIYIRLRALEKIKDYKSSREDPFKMENEPEEGEIIDDYDLIVSSDEELSMRQRIRQLEAENEEIEQIDVISRSYIKINHEYSNIECRRAAKVPTDASSISSTEFVTPKKRKRRKSREHKRRHCHRLQQEHSHQYPQHLRQNVQETPLKVRLKRTHCKRREKMFARKHKRTILDRFMKKDVNLETFSIETSESSECSTSLLDATKYCSNRALSKKDVTFDKDKYVTRDTLRLAVARNTNESRNQLKKSCLKDKLMKQDSVGCSLNKTFIERQACTEWVDIESDNDDVQVIENDPDIQTVDEDSTDSLEEKELRLIALKSAVLKKHMARKIRNAEVAYSPTDFDEMLSSGFLQLDDKLNDIDDVDLEGEDSQTACATVSPEASPHLIMLDDQDESQQMVDCKPIDMDIANSDSEDAIIGSWTQGVETALPKFPLESNYNASNIQFGFYIQGVHDLPPPPPGVDGYEDVPPPPPYHIPHGSEIQDMDLDNEELKDIQNRLKERDDIPDDKGAETSKSLILLPTENNKEEELEDKEEEEALRALLLSKFQSPKNQKRRKSREVNQCQSKKLISANNEISEHFNCKAKPTEVILKEAVKRLKIHSQTEPCSEAAFTDFAKTNKDIIKYELSECDENDGDSLNLLQKLRNRLNIYNNLPEYKNQSNIKINTDESAFEENKVDKTATACIVDTVNSNSFDTTSIDICDITRRLQIIKENVFNSNFNPNPQDHSLDSLLKSTCTEDSIDECLEANQNDTICNQCSIETICQLHKPITKQSINVSERKNIVADFDIDMNPTNFKVTVKNNGAFKTEVSEANKSIDVSYKAKNFNNYATSKVNQNSENCKVGLRNDRLTISSANKLLSIAKPILNDKETTPPTYSFIRTTKIIKPNKIINANSKVELNSKKISKTSESKPVLKTSKPETINTISNVSENSRLITSISQIKHMYTIAPFIISINNSSNESSNDEECGSNDSLFKPLYEYNDNASPLSLNLESPSRTPIRSNSPAENNVNGSTTIVDSEVFNLKGTLSSVCRKNVINKPVQQANSPIEGEKLKKTPLAVRHLPTEAQSEYRRLVHRMKLLENKRKLADIEERKKELKTNKKNAIDLPNVKDSSKEKDDIDPMSCELKTTLVKNVLLRNTTNNISPVISTNNKYISNLSSSSSKLHKNNVLRAYENLYVKFGAGIVNNLDKSLKLVEEAKTAKIAKLKFETRLKELKAEMDNFQAKHMEEQQKINRIYPSICSTNEIITSLKQKRSKVFKAALNLGKTLKGEVYRINNDLKESINTKSKKLATEIKIVNSLKAQNIISIENMITSNTTEQQADNIHNKIESSRAHEQCLDIKLNKVSETKTEIVCCGSNKPIKEENNFESPIKNELGGNKEFQSLEANNSSYRNLNGNASNLGNDMNTDAKNRTKQTSLSTYISPLEHLRNIDSTMDPNGVVCPYDLMGNCEDATCKYIHIATKPKT